MVFFAFLLVDFFAAIEITSMTIAAPKVVDFFALKESFLSFVINSYLYALFLSLLIFLILSRRISKKESEKTFFIEGLIYFTLGSLICYFANNPSLFFLGRIIQGLGAGMAFVGELWAINESFRDEIKKPLMWTEIGFATGIVAGPLIGGVFSGLAIYGWKYIFLFNAIICAATVIIFSLNYQDKTEKPTDINAEKSQGFSRNFWLLILCEGIISAVVVGLEFIFSVYFQEIKDFSPSMTGLAILAASVGIITGSILAARKNFNNEKSIILLGILVFSLSIIALGIFTYLDLILWVIIALFALGCAFGFTGVVIYSAISKDMLRTLYVKGSIIYLLTLQLGSAIGIQAESFWSYSRTNFLILIIIIAAIMQLAFLAAMGMTKNEKAKTKREINSRFWFAHISQIFFFIIFIFWIKYVFNIKISGKEKIQAKKPLIIISNHSSKWDPFLILSALGWKNYLKLYPWRNPVTPLLYDNPWIRWFFVFLHCYKIEPKGELKESLKETLEFIDKEYSIVFFPEGGRVKYGKKAEPKKGIGYIFQHSDVNILPVRIINKSYNRRGFGRIIGAKVVFGNIIESKEVKGEYVFEKISGKLMDKVHSLKSAIA